MAEQKLMNLGDAAAYLHIDVELMEELRKKVIPSQEFHRPGDHQQYYFLVSDLEAFARTCIYAWGFRKLKF